MLFPELLVALMGSIGRRLKVESSIFSSIELAKYWWLIKVEARVGDRHSLHCFIDRKYDRKFLRIHRGGQCGEISPPCKQTSAHADLATSNNPNVWKKMKKVHQIPSRDPRKIAMLAIATPCFKVSALWGWDDPMIPSIEGRIHAGRPFLMIKRYQKYRKSAKMHDVQYFSTVFPRSLGGSSHSVNGE